MGTFPFFVAAIGDIDAANLKLKSQNEKAVLLHIDFVAAIKYSECVFINEPS